MRSLAISGERLMPFQVNEQVAAEEAAGLRATRCSTNHARLRAARRHSERRTNQNTTHNDGNRKHRL
ncbi:hypothetical protein C7S18_01950 [Ahniella affigens]|uniref:Uncharacterized protein n=1 Tax=Ahniella affigens TaxID=2021234 RepID=A0A2P1PMH0_9GAMM|nr:hypothetical protein C7S18_01950 [Ahniella affigens]